MGRESTKMELHEIGTFVLAVVLALGVWTYARADTTETISIGWNVVEDAVGYRVFLGTESGVYPRTFAVTGTETIIVDLEEATNHYLCVRAVNADGLQSEDCSDELKAWPRPTIVSVEATHTLDTDGVRHYVAAVIGTNFRDGQVWMVDYPGVTVESVQVIDSRAVEVGIAVALNTAGGNARLDVLDVEDPGCDIAGGGAGCVYGYLDDAIVIVPSIPPGTVGGVRRLDISEGRP